MFKDWCSKVYYDFQEFAWSNNFLSAASGVAIGVGTKELIEHLMTALVLPLVTWILHASFLHKLYLASLDYVSKQWLTTFLTTFGELLWAITNYAVLIILTFIILEVVIFRKIIGLKSLVSYRTRVDFVRARHEATSDPILPSRQSVERLQAKKALEETELQEVQQEEARKLYNATNDAKLAQAVLDV